MIKTEIFYVVQVYDYEDLQDTFFNPYQVVSGPFYDIATALDVKRDHERHCLKPNFRIGTKTLELELV